MLDHKGFYPRSRLKSMSNAWRGIKIMFRGQYNIWIHTMILGLVVMAGIFFSITLLEWIFIIFAAGMVFAAEAFNTAIEIDMNLTSPEFHPHARDTKDVAAGAVLITAIVALLVGIIIFLPRLVVLMLWQ
ncbi:MAG TPA: diacylglycerol kinase family protein [Candidatus Paceibacterota bacterium]|nr:diacylglycerol kinase family protein [Candidatus Paceibacterota bacterium]